MTGLEPVPVAVDERGLDVAALDGHDVAAVLVAPAHSYPTGAALDTGRRRDLVAWARRHDALIIEDDYDAEFRYDRVPIGALQGLAPDHVVYLGSRLKTVSPALRLGWVARRPPGRRARAREAPRRHGSGLLEQLAFARFVDRGDFARYLRRVRPIYRARRDATIARSPSGCRRSATAGRGRRAASARDAARRHRRAAARRSRRQPRRARRGAARHWADPTRRRRRSCSATAQRASPRSAAGSASSARRSSRPRAPVVRNGSRRR